MFASAKSMKQEICVIIVVLYQGIGEKFRVWTPMNGTKLTIVYGFPNHCLSTLLYRSSGFFNAVERKSSASGQWLFKLRRFIACW